jgi:hypothetical protein
MSVVFWCFGFFCPFFEAVSFHGWVIWTNLGDFNCYPIGLFRKWVMVWLARYSMGLGLRIIHSRESGTIRTGRQATSTLIKNSRRHRLTLSSTFQSPPSPNQKASTKPPNQAQALKKIPLPALPINHSSTTKHPPQPATPDRQPD